MHFEIIKTLVPVDVLTLNSPAADPQGNCPRESAAGIRFAIKTLHWWPDA